MTWFISKMADNPVGIVLASTILVAMGGGMGSIIIGHLAFIDSKDLIWVYKRSPRGIKSLVFSYLYAMLIFNIFIAIFATILFTLFANLDILNAVIFFVEMTLFAEISMCQAMGIQCMNPAYGEKDSNMKGNAMISMVLLQPLMFIPIMSIIFIKPDSIVMMMLISQGLIFLYNLGLSLPLLYFGLRKLKRIE
jgi:hypothetical protein